MEDVSSKGIRPKLPGSGRLIIVGPTVSRYRKMFNPQNLGRSYFDLTTMGWRRGRLGPGLAFWPLML